MKISLNKKASVVFTISIVVIIVLSLFLFFVVSLRIIDTKVSLRYEIEGYEIFRSASPDDIQKIKTNYTNQIFYYKFILGYILLVLIMTIFLFSKIIKTKNQTPEVNDK